MSEKINLNLRWEKLLGLASAKLAKYYSITSDIFNLERYCSNINYEYSDYYRSYRR